MKGKKPTPVPAAQAQEPPKPPRNLTGEARKEWVRITTILAAKRVLSEEDRAALVIYAQSWAMYVEASDKLAEQGTVVTGEKGVPVKNPYLTVVNQAWGRIRPLLSEFGMSPTARARLTIPEVEEDEDEFFSEE